MNTLSISLLSLFASAQTLTAQQVVTVDPEPTPPAAEEKSMTDRVKEKLRNPFAASGGVTNKSSRLIRESLNATKILGILHTTDGNRMAVLQVGAQQNPLYVSVGSTFSVRVSSKEWRDVEVKEITKFEVKVTPKGIDGKIIIR